METTPKKPAVGWASPQLKILGVLAVASAFTMLSPVPGVIKFITFIATIVSYCILYRIEDHYVTRWLKSISGGTPRKRLAVRIAGLCSDEPQVHMGIPYQVFNDSKTGKKTILGNAITSIPDSPAALAATRVVADMVRTSPQRLKYHDGEVIVDLTALELNESEIEAWRELNKIYDQLFQEIADGYTSEGETLKQTVLSKLDNYATKTKEEMPLSNQDKKEKRRAQ